MRKMTIMVGKRGQALQSHIARVSRTWRRIVDVRIDEGPRCMRLPIYRAANKQVLSTCQRRASSRRRSTTSHWCWLILISLNKSWADIRNPSRPHWRSKGSNKVQCLTNLSMSWPKSTLKSKSSKLTSKRRWECASTCWATAVSCSTRIKNTRLIWIVLDMSTSSWWTKIPSINQ